MVDARLNLFKSKDCRLGRFVGFDDFGLIFSVVLVISFCCFGRFSYMPTNWFLGCRSERGSR